MKTLLKSLSLLCVCALLICALPFSVSALTIYSGDFGFEIDTYEKTATLVDYKGSDSIVSVPEMYRSFPVTVIAQSAFSGNTSIEEVLIPASAETIEQEAFKGCSSLTTIDIPSTVTSLGRGICMDCTSLESATVNTTKAKLPDNFFAGCTNLESVQLSDSITQIGTSAFSACTSLNDLSFLNNVSVIGESAFYKNGFTDIEIPEEITSLPYFSFAYSETLQNVIVPASVTFIHPNAFSGSDNVIINCYYDSYAYQFALDHSIPYILLDGVLLGDTNADENVDVADVTTIQQFIAELAELDGIYLKAADANGDGDVDIADATLIQMYVAEYDTGYPIGEPITE